MIPVDPPDVIFIALLLSLFIGTESDAIRKKRIAAQATPDQIHELSALLVKIQQMQSALAATLSLPVGAPEAELIQLQDWLQTLSAQIESVRKNTPVSTDLTKKFELDLKALEINLSVQQARLEKLTNEVNTISNINENIQNKILELQKAILEGEKKINDIWLIPDESITTKRPLLVTVSSEAMELRSLDGILKQTKGNLKELLQDFNSLEFYVVFYLKPSAFPRGEEILDETKKLGFEVGYEPIREDQNINFGKSIL
jgi:predicted  nucleic acid-binding Zn-ribbon protein